MSRFLALSLLMCVSLAAYADFIEIRRNAYIYAEPNRHSQQLDHIDIASEPEVTLDILEYGLKNGYLKVNLRDSNGAGWVHKSRGRIRPGRAPGSQEAHKIIGEGAFPLSQDSFIAHFIDVGQGDATLLEFSCGLALVDTGGEKTSEVDGAERLLNYLQEVFDRRPDLNRTLDLLVLTHAHADHTAGVEHLIDPVNHIEIRNVVDNGWTTGSGSEQQKALQQRAAGDPEIHYQAIQGSSVGTISGITSDVIDPIDCPGTDPIITVLWGSLTDESGWATGDFQNQNNHSVAIRVEFGESSILLTGDMQEPALDLLVQNYDGTDVLDVDIHQVGHHGSHNGLTEGLMKAMTPEIAIISAGNSNLSHHKFSAFSFAHPRDDAVALLRHPSFGVSAFRQDPIKARIGDKGICSTCNPPRPPIFEEWTIEKAIYTTGWGGTIQLSANNLGEIRIARR